MNGFLERILTATQDGVYRALTKDDYVPEEFQLLYGIQQFGHSLGRKPLITMIGMQKAAPEKTEEKRRFRRFQPIAKSLKSRIQAMQSTYKIQMP